MIKYLLKMKIIKILYNLFISQKKFKRWYKLIDLSTARPKWRVDGPALSGNLLYSFVNHASANRYHHHLVR